MSHKKSLALAIAMATAASAPAFAEWSSDPATSAIEVTDSGNRPLVTADNEGGVYVSYLTSGYFWRAPDPDLTGFDVFLQHYDANGNQSWETPLRIFNTENTYHSSYAVVTDGDGNAYSAHEFHPYPNGQPSEESTLQVAKATQDGSLAWNVNLTPGDNFASNALGASMGAHGDHIAVTWGKATTSKTVDGFGGLAVLNSDGDVLWNKNVQIDGRYTFAAKPVVTEDSVIVLLEVGRAVGSTASHYYVQKYALADGDPMWNEPVPITSGDNFVHVADKVRSVQLIGDGEGGIVMSWYHITGYNQGIILLQHVHANGDKDFPGQGLRVSGDLLGNGATSLAYDGDNAYVAWSVHKLDYNENDEVRDFSGVRGVAISRDGEFIWNEDGSTEPTTLIPWRPLVTEDDRQDEWFRGYVKTALTLNQDDKLNLTYAEEKVAAQTYSLFTQIIDPTTGVHDGERVPFSDGAIAMGAGGGADRTIFGQPVLAYPLANEGAVKVVNFDGSGHSGVSEDILVEKSLPVTLAPGEQKTLDLKVLDNAGSMHDNTVGSPSALVNINLNGSDTDLNLGLDTNHLLTDTVPVTVKVQDVESSDRIGTSTVKVRAPRSVAPTIAPMADASVEESDSIDISADVQAASDNLELQWEQTDGPAVEFAGDGAELHLVTDYVAEDTLLTFTLTAIDGMRQSSQSVDILVSNTSGPAISGSDAETQPGAQFTLSPEISGAKAPVSLNWSKASGADTVWTEAENGTLTGTAPLSEGKVVLTLQAVDANGESFSKDFSLTVAEPEKKKKSGGSFGFPAALLLGLAALSRRLFAKNSGKSNQNKV